MKITPGKIVTMATGRAALIATGHDDMPDELFELLPDLVGDAEGYNKLSIKEQYWLDRWYKEGVRHNQKEAKTMQKHMSQTAKVADIYNIVGKSLIDMFGEDALDRPESVKDTMELSLATVHNLQSLLIEKGIVTKDELVAHRKKFQEEVTSTLKDQEDETSAQEDDSQEESSPESN
jgi:hypothetical protein